MKTVEEITRRLLGRHLATIHDVAGVRGQSSAIVVDWNDGTGFDSYFYDTNRERDSAMSDARMLALAHTHTHDVVDYTN